MLVQNVFEKLLGMSVTASVVILTVMFLRLILRRFPKWISYALWAVVLVRLVCPVSIQWSWTLIPQQVDTVTDALTQQLSPSYEDLDLSVLSTPEDMVPAQTIPPEHLENIVIIPVQRDPVTEIKRTVSPWMVWLAGVLVMGLWGAVSYLRLRRSLVGSLGAGENIFLCDRIPTPFVLGITRPRIYLPSDLPREEWDYILTHERIHIRRGDHIFRLLAYGALCLHWFNPLVWLAFWLSGKDMEMSCDEAVMHKLGSDIRAAYAQSLLNLASGKTKWTFVPVGFGEGNTKGRIRNLKKWKKPVVWLVTAMALVCAFVAVRMLTDPIKAEKQPAADKISVGNGVYCWIDYVWPKEVPENEEYRICLEEFPDTTFCWKDTILYAENNGRRTKLYEGIYPRSVYFCDLNGDGYPEICSDVAFEFGLDNGDVMVYDYAAGKSYYLPDYISDKAYLEVVEDALWVELESYDDTFSESGLLCLSPTGNAGTYCLDVRYVQERSTNILPTASTMRGPYDSYLFVTLDGQTYRYRRETMDPEYLTMGALLETYVETSITGQSYLWEAYSTKEYPDRSVLLVCVDGQMWMSYRYAPPQRVSDTLWTAVQSSELHVVQEDGDVTSGQKLWLDFVKKTEAGKTAYVNIAMYHTLDPDSCVEEYYLTHAEDYPCLYLHQVRYDGSQYTVTWEENGTQITRTYKYLMHYYGKPESASASYKAYDKYVLTNDNTVTWEDIFAGMVSSRFGDYIDHYVVYNDYVWYKNTDKE